MNRRPSTADRAPAVSMSGQTKRAERAEIELLIRDFLASGGEIEQLPSEQIRPVRSPAFNSGGYADE